MEQHWNNKKMNYKVCTWNDILYIIKYVMNNKMKKIVWAHMSVQYKNENDMIFASNINKPINYSKCNLSINHLKTKHELSTNISMNHSMNIKSLKIS